MLKNQKIHSAHAQILFKERSQQGMPLKIIEKNFADFLVGSKYEKLCKFLRYVV